MEAVLQARAVVQVQVAAVLPTQTAAEAQAAAVLQAEPAMQTAAALPTQTEAEAAAPTRAAAEQAQAAAVQQVHLQAVAEQAQVATALLAEPAAVEQAQVATALLAALHHSPRARGPVLHHHPHLPRAAPEENSAETCASISIEIPSIAARAHARVLQRKARWRHAAPDDARRSASLVGRLAEVHVSTCSAIPSTATPAA